VAVLAQRLVRRICRVCIQKAGTVTAHDGRLVEAWKGAGCPKCLGTGYAGRQGIFELMELTEELRRLIMSNADAGQLTTEARRTGMRNLREDGWEKWRRITTSEEVTGDAGV
jgi:type II secretory ATPase GspE/PulE/Tfp pilus assembly ATPase PilB-like protein